MVRMVALARQTYDGRVYKMGNYMDVRDEDVADLEVLKFASRVSPATMGESKPAEKEKKQIASETVESAEEIVPPAGGAKARDVLPVEETADESEEDQNSDSSEDSDDTHQGKRKGRYSRRDVRPTK